MSRCRMWCPGPCRRAFVLAAALKLLLYCSWRWRHRRCEGARSRSQLERRFVSKLNIPPVCVYHFIFGSSFAFFLPDFFPVFPSYSLLSFTKCSLVVERCKHVTCPVHLNATHNIVPECCIDLSGHERSGCQNPSAAW